MSHSTKNILQGLSSCKSVAKTDEQNENPEGVPDIPLTPSPALSMSDVLANCLTPRKGDPALTPL